MDTNKRGCLPQAPKPWRQTPWSAASLAGPTRSEPEGYRYKLTNSVTDNQEMDR